MQNYLQINFIYIVYYIMPVQIVLCGSKLMAAVFISRCKKLRANHNCDWLLNGLCVVKPTSCH